MILIDIEIRKCSRIKPLLHKAYDKLEDLLFTLISSLPESMIPKSFINWLGNYTNKRIAELQQQIIHDRWRSVELDEILQRIKFLLRNIHLKANTQFLSADIVLIH